MSHSTQNIGMINTIDSVTGAHRFSHKAMATIYEILIVHADANYAQQAACEAFYELDRLEQELSQFIENSDISRINNLQAKQSVRIGLAAFECLQHSAQMYEETDGAFDITIGPLLKCWLNEDKTMRIPSKEELELALQHTGMNLLQLDGNEHTVKVHASPVHVDLGGIGKGYSVDQLVELLRDWEFDTALIHGGTSSVFALGAPPGTKGWPLTLSSPRDYKQTLARLYLRDQALSSSGLQKGQHIIDPRTARPVKGNLASWACASNAATADALSTAFMIMTPDEVQDYCLRNEDVQAMIIVQDEKNNSGHENVLSFGSWMRFERRVV
ncbi:MAG: FAD:protein FMN transferase [bacterium]